MAFTWNQSITGAITSASINELKTNIDWVDTNKTVCSTHNSGYKSSVYTTNNSDDNSYVEYSEYTADDDSYYSGADTSQYSQDDSYYYAGDVT